eukprot:TRINITY_DN3350_c0_g1_i3.p1 TRINITY_DN3350_c0_g1~~TRINITY_DN3350_c0_g1_i3.p1  ORF type:complete len:541 (-),score=72.08 TRINITY_DN3350_c0_g1_i3:245-1867(-)
MGMFFFAKIINLSLKSEMIFFYFSVKPEEFFQFREMDLFEFLELILKRIDEYDTHPYSQLELEEISKKRVSFFLEHPIHSSFAHASMQKGQQWCKVFPIGFPSRGSLANELIGSKEAKGYELYFNQEICAVEVRREIINGIDGYFFLRKLINKMEVRECRELFHKYGHKFGVAIASADNTHLDVRPGNSILNLSEGTLDEFIAGKCTDLPDYKLSIIDWAHSMPNKIHLKENFNSFKRSMLDFRMYIVHICYSLPNDEMELVLACIFEGFVEGIRSVGKGSVREKLNAVADRLKDDFNEKESWIEYRELSHSQKHWRRNNALLRELSYKWALCSSDHNPLAKPEDESKKDELKEEMKSLAFNLKEELISYVCKDEDGALVMIKSSYHKTKCYHSKQIGSRWVFDMCVNKHVKVVEYDKDVKHVTVLGPRLLKANVDLDSGLLIPVAKPDITYEVFIPPVFKNSPFNLINCHIPEHYPNKSLFHMSEDEKVAKIKEQEDIISNLQLNLNQKIKNMKTISRNSNLNLMQKLKKMKIFDLNLN